MDNTIENDLSKAQHLQRKIPRERKGHKLLFIITSFILLIIAISALFYLKFNSKLNFTTKTSLIHQEAKNIAITATQKPPAALPLRKEVVGFLPTWNIDSFITQNIKNLTQLIYFGLSVNDNGELVKVDDKNSPVVEYSSLTSDKFKEIKKISKENKVKVILSIKNFDNTSIDFLISDKSATDNFTKKLITILKENDLDGVNLDFEYFTNTDYPTVKYLNSFLESLTTSLKKENPQYIISFDVNATVIIDDKAYDMAKIGSLMDQVIIMGYDYSRPASLRTGPVSPLTGGDNTHNITKSLQSLNGRVNKEKIIIAFPFYGYEWQTTGTEFGSNTINNSGSIASYKRVKELLASRSDVTKNWDETSQTPWLVYEQSGAIKQIYYDDPKSFAKKIEFTTSNKLGGIGIWALGYEGDQKDIWTEIAKYKKL